MGVVVQKYGGSSVADLDRMRGVASRIAETRRAGHDVVVVVSAMGNTTNELIALAKQISAKPDRRELDMLISVGERISMALLAMALREMGVPARSLTGSQSGIVTDESHADARVVEVKPDRVRAVLAEGMVAIVAGFQGMSRSREVTTLGRGGSDTTAVVLAAALGAEHCEICSDVDGIWSADPRVVPEAKRLDELGLDEALALARGGAKVLYEDAVRYARDHGVTLVAAATFGESRGTTLSPGRPARVGAAAVTHDDQLVALDLAPGDRAAALALRASGGRVRRRVGSRVWVDVRNAHGGLPASLVALVSAVGTALGEDAARVADAQAALGEKGLLTGHFGAEGDVAWWEVSRERAEEAVRVVHGVVVV